MWSVHSIDIGAGLHRIRYKRLEPTRELLRIYLTIRRYLIAVGLLHNYEAQLHIERIVAVSDVHLLETNSSNYNN